MNQEQKMMTVFLTSSPSGPLNKPNYDKVLDEKNGFVKNLKNCWKPEMRGLIVAADPDAYDRNDEMKDFFFQAFSHSGVPVTEFDIWDHRRRQPDREMLASYDVVVLGGGHVPTQNRYFEQIHLRECLEGYGGIVIGVSAGTMNSAGVVYAQPELPGESVDPDYRRFLHGLGLTEVMVLPHYQMVKDFMLDGKRLMEDITYADSHGRKFLALEDGSYLMITDGKTRLFGRAHRIADGVLTTICKDGESILLA